MPAAAVIPAPVAYTNVAAVKKLVVGFLVYTCGPTDLSAEYRIVSAILSGCLGFGSGGLIHLL